jgi:hypothetical protein
LPVFSRDEQWNRRFGGTQTLISFRFVVHPKQSRFGRLLTAWG